MARSSTAAPTRARYAGLVLLLGFTWLVATGVVMSQLYASNTAAVSVLLANLALWMLLSWPRARDTQTPFLLISGPIGAVAFYWGVALATAYWTQPEAKPAWLAPASLACVLAWAPWPMTTLYYCFATKRLR